MNKCVIVTAGSGEGIGHGISETLAEAGWAVVITDRKQERGERFVEKLRKQGGQAEMVLTDVTSPGAAERAVETALEKFGRLDAVVNNAGIGLTKRVGEATEEEFMKLFEVDFLAAFRFVNAALPELLKNQGGVVNIGSVHARGGILSYAHYAATKCALEGFTRGLAVDHGRHGLRANIVHPGLVESPQNLALIQNFTSNPEQWLNEFTERKQAVPELVTARQVGGTVAFLLSDAGRAITGQKIFVDGGMTALLTDNEPGA